MAPVLLAATALLLLTASLQHEALLLLGRWLPRLAMPPRLRVPLLLVLLFGVHAAQVALYAVAYRALAAWGGLGQLSHGAAAGWAGCLYFSAETFTSLGFGDVTPSGPLRLLAGLETLNGLLLIGWSASSIHLAMERYWPDALGPRSPGG